MSVLVTELDPGRLYLLGGPIELDGRISWVPADARGWQPLNCYVLREPDATLVVDPGPAVLAQTVADQLEELVGAGAPISVLVTRAEPDTTGGLGELARRFRVERLYAGGGPNPFDAFESLGELGRGERIQLERTPESFVVPVGAGGRGMRILRPTIRLLATWWGHDAVTGTLFTSDAFGHTVARRPEDRIADDRTPDVADVRAHLTAKFGWLADAHTSAVRQSTRATFDGRTVSRIAPAHGLVLDGPTTVGAHVAAVDAVLGALATA